MLSKLAKLLLVCFLFLLLSNNGAYVLNAHYSNVYIDKPNTAGIATYVVHMKRSVERFKTIDVLLRKLKSAGSINYVEAVDAMQLGVDELRTQVAWDNYCEMFRHYPSVGTVCCYLSHVKVWKTFLDSDHAYALVLEDDAWFDPETIDKTINLLLRKNKLWDIAALELNHNGTPWTIYQEPESQQRIVVYLTRVAHAAGYVINRAAARRLLDYALPIKMPVDHYFNRPWEFGLKFVGIEPRPITQRGVSQIGAHNVLIDEVGEQFPQLTVDIKKQNKLMLNIKHAAYNIQSSIVRMFYNLRIGLLMSKEN